MQNRSRLRSRPIVWLIGIAAAIAIAGAGYGLWYLFLRPSGPPPVDIGAISVPSATAGASATTAPTPAGASATPAGSATSAPAATASATAAASPARSSGTAAGLDGTWKVDTSLGSFSDFTDSFVGYRVKETLASLGANTAVGRTPEVSGSITLSGTNVTAAEFTADLTGLKSDDDRRDGQLARQGIQTNTFPKATFELTKPIALGSLPADGVSVSVKATGTFTLHGATKSVEIPLQAKLSGSTIVVTGSLEIAFADYGIQAPNSFAVLSVEDHGTLELQLLFTRG
jgi:polyisoprenoid-binding protein YceI